MKKCLIFAALFAASIGVSAQTMKVQSAYSDMKNDRWKNALANIEEACVNEKTKEDAKTWNYAGLIYAKLVELSESQDPKDQKLLKKQKVDIPIHVLLRPRFGDFLYSEEEMEVLIRQAKMFADAGADNLVIGCLIGLGIANRKKKRLKTVHKKKEAMDYAVAGTLMFRASSDYMLNKRVTTRTVSSSSDSDSRGGSSTHTSSSGTTHGGRGGKF